MKRSVQLLIDNKYEVNDSEKKYRALYDNSINGIAFHEIVYDSYNKPINYIITDVNPSYETILSLKKNDVVNKLATKAYNTESPPYLEIYSKVAETTESASFSVFFEPLNKHFKISAFSYEKGKFITIFDDITKQKQAEQKLMQSEVQLKTLNQELEQRVELRTKELKDSEEKYRSLMDGLNRIGIGVDIVSNDYSVIYQNQVLKEKFGHGKGKKCYDIYMELKKPCEFCPMLKAIKSNKIESIELKGSDGRDYELISAPFPDPDGNVDKAVEVVIDITEKKEAEQKLRDSEEKYRDLFENSPIGILLFDENGNFMRGNSTFYRIFSKYAQEELAGKNFRQMISLFKNPKEVLQIFAQRFRELEEGKDLKPIELKIVRENGEERWVNWHSSRIKMKDKTIIQAILQDVTDKKNAEQELKESEEKYRLILENTNDLISIINDKFEHEYINEPAYLNTLGYSEKEILGTNVWELVHPEDIEHLTKLYQISPDGFQEFQEEVKQELRVRHKKGHYLWMDFVSKVFIDSQGKPKIVAISRDITDKKLAEQKLRESEKKLKEKNVVLSVLNRIITLGNESQSLQEFLEKSYDQVLDIAGFDRGGVYLYDHQTQHNILVHHKNVHPDFIAAVEDVDISEGLFARVFDKNKPFYIEDFSKFMEGSRELGVYSAAIVPLRSKDEYVGSMNVASPVHQFLSKEELELLVAIGKQMGIIIQKFESEKLLKESEGKFRTIAEQSFIGILIIKDYHIKYSNQKFADIIGYTRTEIEDWKLEDFFKHVYPEDVKDLIELERRKYEGDVKIIEKYRFRAFTKTGDLIWLEIDSKTIPFGGDLADFTTIMDITERVQSEQKLKESEEKFRVITEQSFIGVLIEQEFNIKYVNQQFSTMLGYSTEELLTWTLEDFYYIFHPDDLDIFKELIDKKVKGFFDKITNYQLRVFKKTGEIIWLELFSREFMYQHKATNLVFVTDITEKKEAERLIIEEKNKLIELSEMRQDIITRVSHELKTPLTSIDGASQMLQMVHGNDMNENVSRFVEIIHRGAIRLKTLINNLLDISRLDAKKFELKIQKENIVEIIKECIYEICYLANNRELALEVDLPAELYFDVDKLRLEQVISNIMSNAIKNTQLKGKIFVDLVDTRDYIDIQIKDTGIGLTEKEKEKIFEKFGKIERYGKNFDVNIEGTGLGLYISKEIVDLHGGQILVESDGRDKGAKFTVRFFKKQE